MNKLAKCVTGLGVVMAGLMGAQAAFATGTDPTSGAGSDLLSSATAWVTSTGIPLVVGLLAIGLVVSLVIKFARRGARAA